MSAMFISTPFLRLRWTAWQPYRLSKRMPFSSINPTLLRTNLWNFGDNCSAFGGDWKTQFFWVGHFFLLHSYLNKSQINGYQGWDEILMITLISSKNLGGYKIMRNTVIWVNMSKYVDCLYVISLWSKTGLGVVFLFFIKSSDIIREEFPMDLAPSSAVAALVISTRLVQRHFYFVCQYKRNLSNNEISQMNLSKKLSEEFLERISQKISGKNFWK